MKVSLQWLRVCVFHGAVSWCFWYEFSQNILISGVDNSPSRHSMNCKNKILILGDGPIDHVN